MENGYLGYPQEVYLDVELMSIFSQVEHISIERQNGSPLPFLVHLI